MRVWLPNWDLTTIPDKVFNSEMSRRRSAKRKVHSGGSVFGHHVPNYSRCRCIKCIQVRAERAALPQPPKRPRGRPRKVVVEAPPPAPPKVKRSRKPKAVEGVIS
jgi:hypothetical protein